MKESPIFIKTYDMLLWLLPQTAHFPKSQRFLLAERMGETALDFYETIQRASLDKTGGALALLEQANVLHKRVEFYVRLSCDLHFFSPGQYEHVTRQLVEIGRLLGGWKKKCAGQSEAAASASAVGAGQQ